MLLISRLARVSKLAFVIKDLEPEGRTDQSELMSNLHTCMRATHQSTDFITN